MKVLSLAVFCLWGLAAVSASTDDAITEEDAALSSDNLTDIFSSNLTAYKPSGIVVAFHNLPHWTNPKPGVVTQDPEPVFKSGNDPKSYPYFLSLLGYELIDH